MVTTQEIVIGIDASTTACKAIAWDSFGNAIVEARTPVTLLQPQPDWYEQSALAWWYATQIVLQEISLKINTKRLAGICICPQRETFVPVNQNGQPLRNALLWMDERARDLLPIIETHFESGQFHHITGKPLSANLTVAKIFWLRENEPAIFEQTHQFVDVAAFLNYKLTGGWITSWGIAGPTGMFDLQQHGWSPQITTFLGLENDQLPTTKAPGSIIGYLTAEAAKNCNLPEGLPIIAGLGDGQAAGLGANITQAGQAYLSLGTSVVSGTLTEKYLTSRAFRTMLSFPGAYSLETVLLGGTYTIDWFRQNFAAGYSLEDLEEGAAKIASGSDGLILVPYWNSVMNPYWDASASGITLGWRGHHGTAHLYRAILEGIAFELRLHFEGVEAALQREIEQLTLMGGGSRSDLWCQVIADITGKNIHRATIPEATAMGAGILAAVGVGIYPNFQRANEAMTRPPETEFIPDQINHAQYTKVFQQIYIKIYPALQDILQQLSSTSHQL